MNSGTFHDFPPIGLCIFYNFIRKFYLILTDMSMNLIIFFYCNNNLFLFPSKQWESKKRSLNFRHSDFFSIPLPNPYLFLIHTSPYPYIFLFNCAVPALRFLLQLGLIAVHTRLRAAQILRHRAHRALQLKQTRLA